jgi:hypothetical protein
VTKYILVIKGVGELEYQAIRDDLAKQYEAKGMEVPIFAYLPQDYAEIELVWIDEEMERAAFSSALEKTNMGKTVIDDFRQAQMMAGA